MATTPRKQDHLEGFSSCGGLLVGQLRPKTDYSARTVFYGLVTVCLIDPMESKLTANPILSVSRSALPANNRYSPQTDDKAPELPTTQNWCKTAG